ncbi:MAG: hypothetical protein EOO22_24040 [Comamonadaceae bacterium]|nr:MAG: hypothetical protein EOO22_24040 [Comamonadaceae bacterium]
MTLHPLPLLLSVATLGALAGCAMSDSEVIRMRDGTLRAPSYAEAQTYCEERKLNSQPVGKAPGDTGVLFRCE